MILNNTIYTICISSCMSVCSVDEVEMHVLAFIHGSAIFSINNDVTKLLL